MAMEMYFHGNMSNKNSTFESIILSECGTAEKKV